MVLQAATKIKDWQAKGRRLAIVQADFNPHITDRLSQAAKATLLDAGVQDADIRHYHVPGAFELPLAAKRIAETQRVDAIICIGCVIRGDTAHFDYVAGESARKIADLSLQLDLPVIFGVLTTENEAQAAERAGDNAQNKGIEAAAAALDMLMLLGTLAA